MMDGLVGWMIVTVAAGSAGIGAVRRLSERRRVRHELKTRPALAVGLPEGTVVRVTGVVQPIDVLIAPLSGQPCVVYRSRVDTSSWMLRGAMRTGSREVMSIAPFALDSGSRGIVLIDGSSALLDLAPVELDVADRVRHQQFMLAQGISPRNAARAQFEETIVAPGAIVTVAGLMMLDPATESPAIERHFRDAPPPTMRLTGNGDHPLVIGTSP